MVDLTIDVRDKKQMERLLTAFRRIPGVRDIERVREIEGSGQGNTREDESA